MSDLLNKVLDAHGGVERWNRFNTVKATIVSGGELWGIKGVVQDAMPREMTVSLHKQRASVTPFGNPDWRTAFRADYIAIETTQGAIVRERLNPREAFAGHDMDTPWDPLHRAYFSGYAMWTYLTMPFLLAEDGVETQEIEPWDEKGESWRRLRIRFPEAIATHSTEQTLYVGADGLLKRHDYNVEIAGDTPGAHFVSDYVEVEGLMFPTKRRIYPRQPDAQAMSEPLVVSIDLDQIELS